MVKRVTDVPLEYSPQAFRTIFRDFDARFSKLEQTVGTYAITNAGSDVRTLDVASATLGDVRDFLGTLVRDLQNNGKLGK